VRDQADNGNTYHVQVTVKGAPLVASNTVAEGERAEFVRGVHQENVVVATFTDADPETESGDYEATVLWGDDPTALPELVGVRPRAGGGFEVYGGHTYARAGSFPVVVTLTTTRNGAPPAAAPSPGPPPP
jgi:hypothetical protein